MRRNLAVITTHDGDHAEEPSPSGLLSASGYEAEEAGWQSGQFIVGVSEHSPSNDETGHISESTAETEDGKRDLHFGGFEYGEDQPEC